MSYNLLWNIVQQKGHLKKLFVGDVTGISKHEITHTPKDTLLIEVF